MLWLALAFFVWPVAFLIVLVGMILGSKPDEFVGRVILERAPYCDMFVMETPLGFVTAVNLTGDSIALSGARRVTGVFQKGAQRLRVDEIAAMQVSVIHFDTDWDNARSRFEAECRRPDLAEEFIAAK